MATPTFTPAPSTYDKPQSVEIKTTTPGATIRYTLNGDTPTAASTEYSSAISIASTKTLKAVAFKSGLKASEVASGEYVINIKADDVKPVEFTPSSGTFPNKTTITLSSKTDGATICYGEAEIPKCDVSGVAPKCTEGTLVSDGKIVVDGPPMAIHAIACKKGLNTSDLTTVSYDFKSAAPTFDPASGTENPSKPVTAKSATDGAVIHFTTDGTAPTCSSPVFTGHTVTADTTINAIACKEYYKDSNVATATYLVTPAPPTLAPQGGTYHEDQTVTIAVSGGAFACVTSGAEPSDPACDGEKCKVGDKVSTITVNKSKTIVKAVSCKAGHTASSVAKETYILTPEKPVLDPATGTIPSGGEVSVGVSSKGSSEVRYTTDGNAPDCKTSTKLPESGKVSIKATTTLKAVGCKDGYDPSEVGEGTYTKLDDVSPVEFAPASGGYANTVSVTLSTKTPGATICYAFSSDPTCDADAKCGTGAAVDASGIVKVEAPDTVLHALACKKGMNNSPSTHAEYTFKVGNPVFNPVSGTANPPPVAVTSATEGAVIHYTRDSSAPTCESPVLEGGKFTETFSADTTLKAIACKSKYAASDVETASYLVSPAKPSFDKKGDTYHADQQVKITAPEGANLCATSKQAEVEDPACNDDGSCKVGENLQTVDVKKTNTIIKAISCKAGHPSSSIVTETYVLAAGNPSFTPPPGEISEDTDVTVTSEGAATIVYTLDGSAPSCAPAHGTEAPADGKVTVSPGKTLKAIGCKTDYVPSAVTEGEYKKKPAGIVAARRAHK